MPLFQSRLFLRIINKNREIYFLKIITLAVAFACTTLITLFSLNEFGFDKFHDDAQAIFRVIQKNTSDSHSGNRLSVNIPPWIVRSVQTNDSLNLAKVKSMNDLSVFTKEGIVHHQKIHAADPAIVHLFTFDILHGSAAQFGDRNRILLSESAAVRYFKT